MEHVTTPQEGTYSENNKFVNGLRAICERGNFRKARRFIRENNFVSHNRDIHDIFMNLCENGHYKIVKLFLITWKLFEIPQSYYSQFLWSEYKTIFENACCCKRDSDGLKIIKLLILCYNSIKKYYNGIEKYVYSKLHLVIISGFTDALCKHNMKIATYIAKRYNNIIKAEICHIYNELCKEIIDKKKFKPIMWLLNNFTISTWHIEVSCYNRNSRKLILAVLPFITNFYDHGIRQYNRNRYGNTRWVFLYDLV